MEGLKFAEAEQSADFSDDDLVKEAEAKKGSATKKVDGKDFIENKDEDSELPF